MSVVTILNQDHAVWVLILGFLLTFLLAFSVGANSLPNAFGTAVGSKVISQLQAIILASIFATLGAVIIGPAVANTVENGIVNIQLYKSQPELLMLGQLSVILATAAWMILATAFKLPIAVTHSVVGAVFGFHVMATGFHGINWESLILIAVSWLTSPILSGCLALVFYFIMMYSFVKKENPLEAGVKTLPVWYGGMIFINVLSVLIQLQLLFHGYEMPLHVSLSVSAGCAILVALLVWFIWVPRLRKESESEKEALLSKDQKRLPVDDDRNEKVPNQVSVEDSKDVPAPESNQLDEDSMSKSIHSDLTEADDVRDSPDVTKMCSPLLLLSVIFAGYAYGSILVSISVAPLSTIWSVYHSERVTASIPNEFWIFIFGTAALIIGFAVFGELVTETIGEGITSLTPSRAFPIEHGTTIVLLIASNFGIPISTTHCKIGAITIVGYFSDGGVNLKLFRNIFLAWVVTLPVTAGMSAGLTALLRFLVQIDHVRNSEEINVFN